MADFSDLKFNSHPITHERAWMDFQNGKGISVIRYPSHGSGVCSYEVAETNFFGLNTEVAYFVDGEDAVEKKMKAIQGTSADPLPVRDDQFSPE